MAKEPADKSTNWLFTATLIAVTYPIIDGLGDWLLNEYVSFFGAFCRSVDAWYAWLFSTDAPAATQWAKGEDLTDGSVFLIFCLLILKHLPESTQQERARTIRRWVRRPLCRAVLSILIAIAWLVIAANWFETLVALGMVLVHPLIMSCALGYALHVFRGARAWQAHRDREFVRARRKSPPPRTMLDNLVS